MAYGAFGDIRALLHGAPSKGTWEKLCAEVRLWREPELSQVVFPYVLAQLERWPDELRVVRPDWALDLLRGRAKGAHFTALARTLHLEDLHPTPDEWDNLTALDWRALRHLRARHVGTLRPWLERTRGAPLLDTLDTLTVVGDVVAGLLGELCAEGALERLSELHVVGSSPTPDDLLELTVASWPRLTSLSLRHIERGIGRHTHGPQLRSLEPLTSDLDAPNLRRVDLASLDHSQAVLTQLLSAPWTPRLTHLGLNTEHVYAHYAYTFDEEAVDHALTHARLDALEELGLYSSPYSHVIDALSRNPTLKNLKSITVEHALRLYSRRPTNTARAIVNSSLPDAVKAQWRPLLTP